jgi:hypothetical protein
LRYIKLFENFIKEAEIKSDPVFLFFPFEKSLRMEDPTRYGLVRKVNLSELIYLSETVDKKIPDTFWKPGKGGGIYLLNSPTQDGFYRYVIRSLYPITFDVARFDKNYEQKEEYLGVNPENLRDASKFKNVTAMFSFLRKGDVGIFEYLKSKIKNADLSAEYGDLFL